MTLSPKDLKKALIVNGDKGRLEKLGLSQVERQYAELRLIIQKLAENESMNEEYLRNARGTILLYQDQIPPDRLTEIKNALKETFPYYFES